MPYKYENKTVPSRRSNLTTRNLEIALCSCDLFPGRPHKLNELHFEKNDRFWEHLAGRSRPQHHAAERHRPSSVAPACVENIPKDADDETVEDEDEDHMLERRRYYPLKKPEVKIRESPAAIERRNRHSQHLNRLADDVRAAFIGDPQGQVFEGRRVSLTPECPPHPVADIPARSLSRTRKSERVDELRRVPSRTRIEPSDGREHGILKTRAEPSDESQYRRLNTCLEPSCESRNATQNSRTRYVSIDDDDETSLSDDGDDGDDSAAGTYYIDGYHEHYHCQKPSPASCDIPNKPAVPIENKYQKNRRLRRRSSHISIHRPADLRIDSTTTSRYYPSDYSTSPDTPKSVKLDTCKEQSHSRRSTDRRSSVKSHHRRSCRNSSAVQSTDDGNEELVITKTKKHLDSRPPVSMSARNYENLQSRSGSSSMPMRPKSCGDKYHTGLTPPIIDVTPPLTPRVVDVTPPPNPKGQYYAEWTYSVTAPAAPCPAYGAEASVQQPSQNAPVRDIRDNREHQEKKEKRKHGNRQSERVHRDSAVQKSHHTIKQDGQKHNSGSRHVQRRNSNSGECIVQ